MINKVKSSDSNQKLFKGATLHGGFTKLHGETKKANIYNKIYLKKQPFTGENSQ